MGSLILLRVLLFQAIICAEAGISGFHKWFAREFPTAVTDSPPVDNFDHVCLDMNQVLHVALRRAENKDQAIRFIFREVHGTLRNFRARKSVVFAFDGSAPLAKMLVQRSRRADTKRGDKYKMSPLHLSPGTRFMDDVASAMEYFAFRECVNPKYKSVKFYISGANMAGEGELKCIDLLKRMSKPDESAVIVGGDADLILQGLTLREVKDTFICSRNDNGAFRLTSIWEVVRSLEKMFPGQSALVRNDLAVLVMFNGNDYLPKMRGVSFSRCFKAYQALKRGEYREKFLVDGDKRTICWKFLQDLLAHQSPDMGSEVERYPRISLEQIDLNSRYQPAGAIFKTAVAQGKLGEGVEIEIFDVSDTHSETSGGMKKWRSSTWVQGKEYAYEFSNVKKEKAVMHLAAERLLEDLLPDLYDDFLEKQKLRALEQALLDEENNDMDSDLDPDGGAGNGSDPSSRKAKEILFDVESYMLGVLWNLQMYIDGYTPNFYWRYGPRFAPSSDEIVSWVDMASEEYLAKLAVPVVRAPPLPAAIACLCVLPMTESGKMLVPRRLQELVKPGSPLLEALEWRGKSSGLDIPKILRILQDLVPQELLEFNNDRSARDAWTVVFLDMFARPRKALPPRPPSTMFQALESQISNGYFFERIQVTSVPATSAPRNLPWSSPSEPSTLRQTPGVLDQPYKTLKGIKGTKALEAGGRSEGPGGRGGRGGRGKRAVSSRSAAPPLKPSEGKYLKKVELRKETSERTAIRRTGGSARGTGVQHNPGNAARSLPRRAPAAAVGKGKARRRPFSSRRGKEGSSMCFGSSSMVRSQCRLLL